MPLDGKAVNAIRTFIGRGTLVWGARTLAGNETVVEIKDEIVLDRAAASGTVRVEQGPYTNSVNVELRLTGVPEGAEGSLNGTLVIELGHPDLERLELPILGACRKRPPR